MDTDLSLLEALDELSSAEDFLDYFSVPYTPSVVQVNRLHILQRFHDYLGQYAAGRIRPAQHLPAVAGARLPGLCRIRRADRKSVSRVPAA